MNARRRLAIEAMLDGFSQLHVYIGCDGTEESLPKRADHPLPGSGAILHDCVDAPSPIYVSRKIVAGLRRYGTIWDFDRKCEVMTPEGRALARAAIQGRDFIWVHGRGVVPDQREGADEGGGRG